MRKFSVRVLTILLCLLVLVQWASAAKMLVPGGQIIGLELQNDAVTVAAFDTSLGDAAKNAGLQIGDRILKIDKSPITCPEDVRQALTRSKGTVKLQIQRKQEKKQISLTPRITQDGPRLGVYLKQGISGIGTVTYYDPQNGSFGALGHGVCTQGKELTPIRQGTAYDAAILTVKKGKCGTPGQLIGSFENRQILGSVTKNTRQGVFGTLTIPIETPAIPTAAAGEIHTGKATIRSTVNGDTPREYSVEITKIYAAPRDGGRNMLLKITDPALLEATGGIVQGMSGSPIIQDGKLIGAVTHVLVNDPTQGYGIFIENMLDAAS